MTLLITFESDETNVIGAPLIRMKLPFRVVKAASSALTGAYAALGAKGDVPCARDWW